MTLREELIQYSEDVIAGKVKACKKHRWACMRFLHDLEREDTAAFPYVFNEAAADRFLEWMRLFKHRKGVMKGQLIEPHIIQKFIFGNIYGWHHRDTGYRRFSKAYWQVGRKNAKSQSLACVGSYELMALGEGASEVYCAATKVAQAKIVWSETEAMLNECAELRGRYRVAYGEITHPRSGSVMKALSKEDRKTGDGYNPQCGIIDEYHAHPTAEMYDIIDSGMGARTQPLLMIITTAGFELNHPCYSIEYKLVTKILDPSQQYMVESYFIMINELERDDEGNLIDDIHDESCWEKANPIICTYPEGLNYLRERLKIAQEAPEKMRDVMTKNMNIWVNQRANGYMNMEKWALCRGVLPDLEGCECIIGIDLSTKIDLTSVGFEFFVDGKYVVLSHSFMPEDTVEAKRKTDNIFYDTWVKQGHISTTPGSVIDYRFVMEYIKKRVQAGGWIVKELCFDPWNAQQLANEMQDEGFECIQIVQGMRTLSEPTKSFRDLVYSGQVVHDGNPVLEWAIGNAVMRFDSRENIMLDKEKSTNRIDPIASILNAHVRSILFADTTSIYDEEEIKEL